MGTTRLYFTATVEEQWHSLAGPWLREHAAKAWRNPRPTAVLTPSRAESFYLRSRLVKEGVPFLGLYFWTPSDVRKFLLGELLPDIGSATQAELRLMARECAEKLLRREKSVSGPRVGTFSSVRQDPGAFLRAYDLLLGAGWNSVQHGSAYGRALAQEMEQVLEKSRIATQAGLHRHLLKQSAEHQEALIANLLMIGFNAVHWPLWDLLRASVRQAEQAVVALSAPRVFGEEIDQLWISSWEEASGVSVEIPENSETENTEGAFSSLVASYEKGEQGAARTCDLTFLVTPELSSQIQSVVLKALDYLKRDACTRFGIVFPEANALALGVVEELQRLGIPLDDGTGSIRPGIFEKRFWKSWIELQEEPSVQSLIRWVRACEAQGAPWGMEAGLSARKLADVLENALGESLVDDLDFLARHLEEASTGDTAGTVARFLRQRLELPKEMSFAGFLTKTREALAALGWKEHLARLEVDPPAWLMKSDAVLSRRTFLEWLKESTDSRERIRSSEGNHFYGKVHLLIYAQMTGQTWSHLILTGLNEGVWPRLFEAGAFGSRHELEALNQEARSLNHQSTMQGGQGEGHESVLGNRGHCLLPRERQDLALRDLCVALEGTSAAACLTAMTTEAGRSLLPSDFLNHAYQARTGHVLDEATFQNLADTTLAWCRRHGPLLKAQENPGITPAIAATQIAYEARRDITRPFGPYEFAFAAPPAALIQLSCKTWEEAWNHPASVWLKEIVGVAPWPEGTLSWPRAIGTWVHRWLATTLRTCRERNTSNDFLSLLREVVDREPLRMKARANAVGIELYPWWEQVWGQARSMALGLGEALAPHLQDKRFLSEFRLPENIRVALPGSELADFALTGRIDLLLVDPGVTSCNPDDGDFSGCTCWVIDFKTGSVQNLNEKKIEKGAGLQAVLYGLAVRARGAKSTGLSLLTFDAPLKLQVYVEDVLEIKTLFHSLDKLHRVGIFGMRGNVENEYGYALSYPMATRFVPGNILDAKWELVHGSASTSEEDEA